MQLPTSEGCGTLASDAPEGRVPEEGAAGLLVSPLRGGEDAMDKEDVAPGGHGRYGALGPFPQSLNRHAKASHDGLRPSSRQ